MKNAALLSIALALFALAAAVIYHAETGRYRIVHAAGPTAYMADTRTGAVSVCSPLYEKGCITIAEAHRQIIEQRDNVLGTMQSTSDKIDRFTKDRAGDLRGVIDRLKNEPEAPPPGMEAE